MSMWKEASCHFRRAMLHGVLLAMLIPMPGRADDETARREDALKAGYLVNFIKFVEWPPGSVSDELTVCFIGAAGVREALASGIETKRAGQHRLAVQAVDAGGSRAGCEVVYVDATASSGAVAPSPSMLTVSDAADFVHRGGMIELFTAQNRLRFNINVENAQRAGLRISSALLKLASAVEKQGS
jgi:hypothetical protein